MELAVDDCHSLAVEAATKEKKRDRERVNGFEARRECKIEK